MIPTYNVRWPLRTTYLLSNTHTLDPPSPHNDAWQKRGYVIQNRTQDRVSTQGHTLVRPAVL